MKGEAMADHSEKIAPKGRVGVNLSGLAPLTRIFGDAQSLGLLVFLVVLSICFSFMSPVFFSVQNLLNVLLSVSIIGVMAAVSTLVVVGRGLDLSVGSVAALSGVVAGMAVETAGYPWWIGVIAGITAGTAAGVFNGIVVTVLNINPIITTIGTLSLFRGVAFIITDGHTIAVNDEVLLFIGSGRVLGIPVAIFLLVLVFLLCHIVAEKTKIGRSLYAIGASPRASLLSGLNLRQIRFWAFAASGASAGVAGLLLVGQSGTAVPSAATAYELLVVTAVLLGGTSLAGGEGRTVGTLLGVLIIGTLNNGMTLLAVPSFYQIAANGLLLLVAVWLDQLRRGPQIE